MLWSCVVLIFLCGKHIDSPELSTLLATVIWPLFEKLFEEGSGLRYLEDVLYYLFKASSHLKEEEVEQQVQNMLNFEDAQEVIMTDTTIEGRPSQEAWKPEIIQLKGLYLWPFQPLKTLKWLKGYLFNFRMLLHSGMAVGMWLFLTLDMARMQTFELDWILFLYGRNVILLTLVTGAVHYYLYIRKGQGTQFKFNPQWPETNNPTFLFGNQNRDNVFWCIVSGCTIWTAYEALTYWMFANGYLFFANWMDSPVYFLILFLAVPYIHRHHFYFVHRLLHWKPLYKAAHYLHHKNTNPGPWSGFSMHPIEHLLYLSGVFIYWIIPAHPLHALHLLQLLGIGPVFHHSGFEKFVIKNKVIENKGYDHYLHHRYFECNYGTPDIPWDNLFGTFHNGSEEAQKTMIDRLKRRHG